MLHDYSNRYNSYNIMLVKVWWKYTDTSESQKLRDVVCDCAC